MISDKHPDQPLAEETISVSRSSTAEEFCKRWLSMQCSQLPSVEGGVVVLLSGESGKFSPAALWPEGAPPARPLMDATERVLAEAKGICLKQDPAEGDGGNRLPGHSIGFPLLVDNKLRGAVAIDLGPAREEQARAGLDLLVKNSAWIEGLLARKAPDEHGEGAAPATNGNGKPATGSEQLQIKGVLDLLASTLQADTFHSEATSLVTELATRLQCERASIGFVHRQRIRMEAVSHSAEFGKKTNLVRAIEAAMDESLDQESIIQHPEPSNKKNGDFKITRFHEVLSRHTGSTQICSIPLALDSKIVAVLTLESQKADPFSEQAIRFCETACSLTGPYLELKRRDERGLLSKLADSGRFLHSRLTEAGYGAWKIAGGILLAAIVFFTFAHGDYRIPAQTVLEGSIQQAAVAPFSGFIAEAPTRAGDVVEKGQVLCRLDDKDMALERSRLQSRHQQLEKQYSQALALLNKAQVKIIGAQVRQAKAQLDQVDAQLEKIEVKAPFKGVVVDGDLSQSIGAPVERGDVLFQVAPLDSYRVIQEIDESDISHLSTGQAGEMVLSAFPSRRYPFVVEKITPVSISREGRNFFRVESSPQGDAPGLRPGMEGYSKVNVDRRRLIWIWTHKAFDWLRLKSWSWLP